MMSITHGIHNIFSTASRNRCLAHMKKIVVHNQFIRPETGVENSLTQAASLMTSKKPSAAVLVPLCDIQGVPAILYTLRAVNLRTSSGEISFPGGRAQTGETASQTAVRATREEIGLSGDKIDVWGHGPALPAQDGVPITPVVASIHNLTDDDFFFKDDVAQVFTVPVELLCDPMNQHYTLYKNGFVLPVFVVKQFKIWGATAYITHLFLNSILSPDVYSNNWMDKKMDKL